MSDATEPTADNGELVLYATEDGGARFFLRTEGGSVWLTQAEIADLFQTTPQNITQHVKSIYGDGEANEEATCKSSLQVQTEGGRAVRRTVKSYNLDLILAVGYRVKSARGTQFRRWATTHLKQYLIKGFVIDDARLKDPGGWDYFDELLQRIREIRASEKRFYQKVRDLFALSSDYQDNANLAGRFFAEVQNKMLHAVTEHTAAEIITLRADPSQPNMGLSAWKAGRVRKEDVIVAKNYLNADEVDHLNRIVTLFLEFAELRVRQRKVLSMADWRKYVDNFLEFNESPLLHGAGRISHADMVDTAYARYAQFDGARRQLEAAKADDDDLTALEQAEKLLTKKGGRDDS